MSIGEQIKEAREGKGYSQEELAEMCGVSRQAVSKWENGLSVPQGANREALCNILEMECLREENFKEAGETRGLRGRLFIWGGWVAAALLFVCTVSILLYVLIRQPGEQLSNQNQFPGHAAGAGVEVGVCFFDGEQNEVYDEALWYNAAHIDSILIQWEGESPDSISIHYVPSGSETMEFAEILSTKAILDSGTAALLNPGGLKDGKIHGHVTFQLNYGGYTVNSEMYNIFYDPSLPPAGM